MSVFKELDTETGLMENKSSGPNLSGVGAAVGGIAGGLMTKDSDYNIVDTGAITHSSQLGFGEGSNSAAFQANEDEIMAKHQKVGAGLTTAAGAAAMIPGVGWIASGVLGLAGGLTSAGVFKSNKKEEERRTEDTADIAAQYSNMTRTETQQSQQAAMREASYAMGGYTDTYLNLFSAGGFSGSEESVGETSSSMYKINSGNTHEVDPNGGVTISTDNDGVPNKAEKDEVVVELPSGQFVFSNRF